MMRLEKTLRSKWQQVFLLTMLALGGIFAEGMGAEVIAEMSHFSRACVVVSPKSTNESGTWNWMKPLDGYYYVVSQHYGRPNGSWIYYHQLDSGWNTDIDATSLHGLLRSMATHWVEDIISPGVVGHHFKWDFAAKRAVLVKGTWTTLCNNWRYF